MRRDRRTGAQAEVGADQFGIETSTHENRRDLNETIVDFESEIDDVVAQAEISEGESAGRSRIIGLRIETADDASSLLCGEVDVGHGFHKSAHAAGLVGIAVDREITAAVLPFHQNIAVIVDGYQFIVVAAEVNGRSTAAVDVGVALGAAEQGIVRAPR